MASLRLLSLPSKFCSSLAPLSRHYIHCIPSLTSLRFTTSIKPFLSKSLVDSFDLPPDYFAKLPSDLRLNCGHELGETLLNLSKAWELADTSTSHSLASKLPLLGGTLADNAKSAFGKRLASAGRRFQSMGQYGQGESQKFGELQVEVTPDKANIGTLIGFVFGLLSWVIAQGIQSIPESSLQYANENALLLAKSLRGPLLALFYSSTFLSGFTTVGLVLLGIQLKSKEN